VRLVIFIAMIMILLNLSLFRSEFNMLIGKRIDFIKEEKGKGVEFTKGNSYNFG